MHHHHEDDPEALGIVDPLDAGGGTQIGRAHANSLSDEARSVRHAGFASFAATLASVIRLWYEACVSADPPLTTTVGPLMRVAMIGTGYVGLVSGACFADFGHHVVCVDKDRQKIAALHRGEMPIYEPGLDDLVAANVKAGRLSFATDLKAPVAAADAVFI